MIKENPKSLRVLAALAALWLSYGTIFSHAVADTAGQKTCLVQVVDHAGKPVKGATVMLAGEKPTSDSRWAEGMDQPDAHASQSDDKGIASVSYYANPYPKEGPPGIIRLLVQYPDGSFLCTEANILTQQPIKLSRGSDVELSPSPLPGVTFTNSTALLQTDQWPANLPLKSPPNRSSIAVNLPAATYRVRLTAHSPEGKAYYSDLAKITVNANSGGIGEKSPVKDIFPVKDNTDVVVPQPITADTKITKYDDFLILTNTLLLAWIWFAVFCAVILKPSWLPLKLLLGISTGFLPIAYLALGTALKSITPVFLLIYDLFAVIIWTGLVGLLYLIRKKGPRWLFWACTPLLGLMVLILVFVGYRNVESLMADFNPSYAYKLEFGFFPSSDVRDIQSTRDNLLLDHSQVILKFHASQKTFEQIKPRDLTQLSYEQFEQNLQNGLNGGQLASYIRQGVPTDNLDPAGDQIMAAWGRQFSAPGEQIWYLANPSDREMLMTYEPSSGTVQYFFFEVE